MKIRQPQSGNRRVVQRLGRQPEPLSDRSNQEEQMDMAAAFRADKAGVELRQPDRIRLARTLQHNLGNARTAQIISRSGDEVAAPALQRSVIQRGFFSKLFSGFSKKKPKKVDAKGADELIRKHFSEDLPEATKKNAKAEGHVNIVGESEFKAAYKKTYGEIDDDYEYTNAFVDRSTDPPTVWGHKKRINPTTVLHEGMHFYSNLAWKNTVGFNANEGVTEYFTRLTVAKEKLPERDNYQEQYDEIVALCAKVGEAKINAAYFKGEVDAVKEALDAAAAAGAFDEWVQAMKDGDWGKARAALSKTATPVESGGG